MHPDPAITAEFLATRDRANAEAAQREAARLRALVADLVDRARGAHGAFEARLIGTLAFGDFGPTSDIDLVVRGLGPRAMVALWRDLEAATGRSVDLLDWAQLAPEFADRVAAEGVPL
ncbi:MAG: hypothetical protein FJ100_07135 [Deltaproteobacteria bacterium]|nr:hypothetical protein [Deltaproteobacteria bacterium]